MGHSQGERLRGGRDGDGLAFSRESDAEVVGDGQRVMPHGEKIKALEMISLRHATRLLC